MNRSLKTVSMCLSLAALAACSSTGIVPMDKGTYVVSKRSAQIGFGPADGAKADVYTEANAFCAKSGKTLETVKLEMTPSALAQSASASLEFRCV